MATPIYEGMCRQFLAPKLFLSTFRGLLRRTPANPCHGFAIIYHFVVFHVPHNYTETNSKLKILTKIFFRLTKRGDRGKPRYVSEIERNVRRKKIEFKN